MTWESQGWAEAAVEYRANGKGAQTKLAAVAPRHFQLVPFNDLNPGTAPPLPGEGPYPARGHRCCVGAAQVRQVLLDLRSSYAQRTRPELQGAPRCSWDCRLLRLRR